MIASDNPFADSASLAKEKETLKSSSVSVISTETAETLVNTPASFTPGRSLFIDARGKALVRLPTPSSQLEIHIHNPDTSLAYVSTRKSRCSGSSTLSSPECGDLLFTEYFFGPNREPRIHILTGSEKASPEVKIKGKWTSRATNFSLPDGSVFEWRYVKECGPDGKKEVLVVLEKFEVSGRKRVAHLLRNKRTRPPNTSRCTAGNGGELVIGRDTAEVIDEPLIVATCLLMLKKEIDRRRAIQACVIFGGAGSV
ncbi:hypothetical protein RJZ56_000484 [Blastomyces dermatitidis]|uniref:Uncharacterized protein n=1 Tax=Ajellomyces dermatitidis (strain ER-3 / ATCC MYA-2586) TaxID=559297 RepID=A0ABP2EWC6_AJEDR|nr:uncharacterized protein BDCG_03448 [Blastomyces dermatitidis ER-3]XP_045280445.1 hypothetical protein, variant [Blastomyces dermatitidis ER-3]EQL33586.1 hypothetical protein BDFG_04339 [Blastomyces dermatitidis ATCC 26199]EEQ88327.1 hypothetical protein BDCG_03448 [Blastomyces dermatitidis ER-3]EQL33587.1 hypothetical protein, variant [Blastomyces dermatitidis ATCC 26199]OAT00718.1 hypothetical protein, variant [Blastomyces dermatitidis ER-3]